MTVSSSLASTKVPAARGKKRKQSVNTTVVKTEATAVTPKGNSTKSPFVTLKQLNTVQSSKQLLESVDMNRFVTSSTPKNGGTGTTKPGRKKTTSVAEKVHTNYVNELFKSRVTPRDAQ